MSNKRKLGTLIGLFGVALLSYDAGWVTALAVAILVNGNNLEQQK